MSGGTLKRVMMRPFRRPANPPAPTARTMAIGRANPTFFQNTPTRIAERPSIEPTDRSMPPVTITKVMVSATRPTSDIRRPWLRRLSAVKKRSDCAARTTSATTTSTARIVSCRSSRRRDRAMGRSSEGPAAPGHVGEHRYKDQEAEDRLQPVGGNIQEDEGGADGGEEDGGERRADDRAGPAQDRDAADHRGRDHVELEVGRNGRLDDLELAREQDGRDPGEEAVQREDEYDGRLGLDAGGARSVRIAADCVDRPAQRGVAHPQRRQHGQDGGEPDRGKNPEEAELGEEETRRQVGDPGARGRADEPALQDRQHAQGHDDGGDARIGDEHAVDGLDGDPGHDGGEPRHPDRIPANGERARDGGEHADQRPHRAVDVARDDDHGRADRSDGDVGVSREDAAQVVLAEERRVHRSRQGDDRQQQSEDDELLAVRREDARQASILRGQGSGGDGVHQATSRLSPTWVMAAPTASAVASARSKAATMRPPLMTRTRSAMPSTSGNSLEIMMMPRPCWASLPISAWISALAPTSMPRVGSSMISMRGSVPSHFATTTFCWFPPESWRAIWSVPRARIPRRSMASRARFSSPRRSTMVAHEMRSKMGSETFSRRVCARISPCSPRSSGM